LEEGWTNMKILINLTRPDFTVSVALHEDGETVSVGIVGKPFKAFFPTAGERTVEPGYWEVTGKHADYIAHAANWAHHYPGTSEVSELLKVLAYYLPVAEETIPLSEAQKRATECGDKNWDVATRYHCEWFEGVLHKIGAQCGASSGALEAVHLVLETVKEAQKELQGRREAALAGFDVEQTVAPPPRSIPHPRSMENVRR
jgi:hypothetical protein